MELSGEDVVARVLAVHGHAAVFVEGKMGKRLAKGEPLAPIAARIVMQFVDAGNTLSHIAPKIVSHVDELYHTNWIYASTPIQVVAS